MRFALILALLLTLSACAPAEPPEEPLPSSSAPPVSSAPIPEPEPEYLPLFPDAASRLAERKSLNPDTVAWLTIPGSGIDEPVFQTSDNTFYLFHDENMQRRQSGSLFVDYECSLADGKGANFSQNTIIYGHNLGNPPGVRDDPTGERFARLLQFADEAFAREHPYVFLTTAAGVQTCEVFTVAYIDAQPEPVSNILPDYPAMAFDLLVSTMRERSLYDYQTAVTAEDRILTLSCCTHKYGTERENPYQRFVVLARLVRGGEAFHETASLAPNPDIREPDFTKYQPGFSAKDEIARLNWKSLTPQQKREDIETLAATLRENYPYAGLLGRLGFDLDTYLRELCERAEATRSDAEFYELLSRLPLGNPYVESNPWSYPDRVAELRAQAVEEGGGSPLWPLYQLYASPRAQEAYRLLAGPKGTMDVYRAAAIQQKANETRHNYPGPEHPGALRPDPATLGESGQPVELLATPNIEAALLRPGRAAYLRFARFDRECVAEDEPFLRELYARLRDYEHVIFDFTETQGEFTGYFDRLIAAPNLSAPLTARYTAFMRSGANNRRFYDLDAWMPALPPANAKNPADLAALDRMREVERRVEPTGGTPPGGKLWFLVGQESDWAAQYAAFLAKESGFATIVGEETAGCGIGEEPVGVLLPHIGLIVRYSADYVLLPDGRCGQEAGVLPDFQTDEDSSALETCLRLIGL